MMIGRGSYGEVSIKNGNAVKKFTKLSHLIQEYIALRYLDDCKYIVHSKGADFARMELHMKLYDSSLREWLDNQRAKDNGISQSDIMKILHDILMGLVELHDRELAHGDLKPSNILVANNPLKAVLGDCGFVSIAKYAKVERTALIYRDPVVNHDKSHDMFSFGICFLEIIANIKINRQGTYEEFKTVVKEKIHDSDYRKIIYNLLHEDKTRRPSARNLLTRLFKENPHKWIRENLSSPDSDAYNNNQRLDDTDEIRKLSKVNYPVFSISDENRKYIRDLMKRTAFEYKINRGKKGYGALLSYIDRHSIDQKHHRVYIAICLMILSSLFGKSGFKEEEVLNLCKNRYEVSSIHKILKEMLSDSMFIKILLAP